MPCPKSIPHRAVTAGEVAEVADAAGESALRLQTEWIHRDADTRARPAVVEPERLAEMGDQSAGAIRRGAGGEHVARSERTALGRGASSEIDMTPDREASITRLPTAMSSVSAEIPVCTASMRAPSRRTFTTASSAPSGVRTIVWIRVVAGALWMRSWTAASSFAWNNGQVSVVPLRPRDAAAGRRHRR